ncbi:MAG: hypothetical protein K1X31_11200 [Gemmatimonadaceae bacterium]|nr:hypothetical protein [Gemmatimonadaceae bacterium]
MRYGILSSLILLAACGSEGVPPVAATNDPLAYLRPHAYTIEVNLDTDSAIVVAPSGLSTPAVEGGETPTLAMIGADAADLFVTDVTASAPGAQSPGRVRVTLALAIENRLPGQSLLPPRWPAPPAEGLIVFPVALEALAGTTGNNVIGTQAAAGNVYPSPEWNGTGETLSGSPYDFLHGTTCTTASDRCRRWEHFRSPLSPMDRSAPQQVGFDVDPSVRRFRAHVLLVAEVGPPL